MKINYQTYSKISALDLPIAIQDLCIQLFKFRDDNVNQLLSFKNPDNSDKSIEQQLLYWIFYFNNYILRYPVFASYDIEFETEVGKVLLFIVKIKTQQETIKISYNIGSNTQAISKWLNK